MPPPAEADRASVQDAINFQKPDENRAEESLFMPPMEQQRDQIDCDETLQLLPPPVNHSLPMENLLETVQKGDEEFNY